MQNAPEMPGCGYATGNIYPCGIYCRRCLLAWGTGGNDAFLPAAAPVLDLMDMVFSFADHDSKIWAMSEERPGDETGRASGNTAEFCGRPRKTVDFLSAPGQCRHDCPATVFLALPGSSAADRRCRFLAVVAGNEVAGLVAVS